MQKDNFKDPQEKEESFVEQLISKYLPYWPLFVVAIIVALGVGYAYLRYTIPVYEATATIIIKDEKKGNEDSKLMESLDQISSKKIVENEIEVIQSRKLMSNVVKDLGLYAPIFQKNGIKASSAYLTCPVSIKSPFPDSIMYFKKIKLTFNEKTQEVTLDEKLTYPLNQIIATPFGKLEFVTNKNYQPPQMPVKEYYFSLINPRDIGPALLGALKVEPSSKLSSVINLSYYDQVPKRAEDILNQLIDSYKQSEISEKDALAKNTLKFVEERLNMVTHDLDSIEKKIQRYKSGQGAVDISTQGQLYLQNVSTNDQKLSEVNTQLSVLNEVENFVTNKENANGVIPSTLGISDPTLSKLIDKLYTSQLEYEKLRKTVGENNPALVGLRDEINKIKPNILQNIKSQEQGLNATKQNLFSTNGSYNSILQAVPQKERELLDISREQQIKSNIYSFLLQKKEESELAYAATVSDNRVVDYAQAGTSPVSPKIMFVYLICVVTSLGLCFAFIMIKDSVSGKVLYRNEIESRTSIPILGEVAFDKSKTPLVIESGKRSFIAEEFRKLRISLSFLGIDSRRKKILVTSSISGEGKSFVAANLAVSLALTGKKVALVDMDLNNPTIASILKVHQEDGISDYLSGLREPEEIIKRVKAHDNLFFISAGTLPENPTELLANGKVKDIIDYLDNIFDVVIIDTSPIVLVTDAYILSELCDATLYVIRHNYTPKILIKRIDESSKINPINNPAIIFNGVKVRGFFKNNYGYGYDYVYGSKNIAKKEKKSVVKY